MLASIHNGQCSSSCGVLWQTNVANAIGRGCCGGGQYIGHNTCVGYNQNVGIAGSAKQYVCADSRNTNVAGAVGVDTNQVATGNVGSG